MKVLAQGHVARPDSNPEVKPGAQGAKSGEALLGLCECWVGAWKEGTMCPKSEDTPPSITLISSTSLVLLTKGELQLPAPLLYSCFKSCTKYICQYLSSCERRAGCGLVGFFPCQCSVELRVEKQVPATSPKGALTLSQTLCQVPNMLYFTSSTTRPL